jgi:predicted nucleotidyltransferase
MASKLRDAIKRGLVKDYPSWLPENLHYEVIMGSMAYGVSTDSSDMDIYGWCIPPKQMLFPHLAGEIEGFGTQKPRFNHFQMHHVVDHRKNTEYDFSIYNIAKYFQLAMDNNPNMIDSLFVPLNCITHMSKVGQMVREQRREFLHKGSFHKMKGYAYAQMSKIENGANRSNEKRKDSVDKYGYDVKFGYHLVRLMDEAEQILTYHDLDLQKNNEQLKAIRRGEVSFNELKKWFASKETQLETLYANSTLRQKPDEGKIRQLLVNCLEDHYGSLADAVRVEPNYAAMGEELRNVLKRYGV